MKRVLRIVGIVVAVIVAVAAAGAGYVFSQMGKAQGPRVDATQALGVLSGISYVWLVPTAHGAFLIDAGNDGGEAPPSYWAGWGLAHY